MSTLLTLGCSEEVGSSSSGQGGQGGQGGGSGGLDVSNEGTPLTFDVPAEGLVLIDLDEPRVLTETDTNSTEWELALGGYDVFTNSGVSGPGSGGAFGPLNAPVFLLNEEPEHPFLLEDRTGGAFLRWYAYEGTVHALWSRYHVYGIQDGDALYKLQVLSYYGELQGAPVSAIYQLRWASVDESGSAATETLLDVDGTAGGLSGGPEDPTECLDLGTGARTMLTLDESLSSSAWHVCFRRDAISVNGELGGPRGIGAIDLTRHADPVELPVETVKTKTPEGELPAFDAVDFATLSDPSLVYRGDRIVSAFGTSWYEAGATPVPTPATWLVQSSDGQRKFLLFFETFEQPGANSPNKVTLRVKQVSSP